MTNSTEFALHAYDFALPEDRIAQFPAEPRDSARLLHLDRASGRLDDLSVRDWPRLVAPGTLLVLNDTKVVPARLMCRKATGGRVELLLERPLGTEGYTPADGPHPALYRASKGLKPDEELAVLTKDSGQASGVTATVHTCCASGRADFRFQGADGLDEILERCGHVPLPPYIRHGEDQPADRARYQTLYARHPGAVAAPTAGLHLTPAIMAALRDRGIDVASVTLHVGPGTFLPVRHDDLRRHTVLSERFSVSAETAAALDQARRDRRPIAAVGTTTTRTLETLAQRCADGPIRPMQSDADLTILPGHRFRLVDALLTNFHLPRSSLLVLVSTFAGRQPTLAAYRHAVDAGYRFYSYGDAMWIA
jgi:S-adenosylmethionine:tRNA ribosyltransferase-isomerase